MMMMLIPQNANMMVVTVVEAIHFGVSNVSVTKLVKYLALFKMSLKDALKLMKLLI